jgi:hypothetical protein
MQGEWRSRRKEAEGHQTRGKKLTGLKDSIL